jgi:hypothetical protein
MLQQSILQYTSVLPKYSMIWCIFKDLFKTSKDCGDMLRAMSVNFKAI